LLKVAARFNLDAIAGKTEMAIDADLFQLGLMTRVKPRPPPRELKMKSFFGASGWRLQNSLRGDAICRSAVTFINVIGGIGSSV